MKTFVVRTRKNRVFHAMRLATKRFRAVKTTVKWSELPPPPPSLLWFLVDGSSLWRSPGRNTQSEKSCPKIQHHVLLTHVMHLTQSRTLWLVKSDFCFVDIFHLHFAVYLPVIKQLDNYLNRRIKDTCVLNNDVRRDSVSTTLFLIYIKYPYKI